MNLIFEGSGVVVKEYNPFTTAKYNPFITKSSQRYPLQVELYIVLILICRPKLIIHYSSLTTHY